MPDAASMPVSADGPDVHGQDGARARAGTALPARDRERGLGDRLSGPGHRHVEAVAVGTRAVPHHLIDVCDPAEAYSAGRFRRDALAPDRRRSALAARVPLLVGGTMLYFRALTHGHRAAAGGRSGGSCRRSTHVAARKAGPRCMRNSRALDPEAAARIRPAGCATHPACARGLAADGRTRLGTAAAGRASAAPAGAHSHCCRLTRPELYERIDARFDDDARRRPARRSARRSTRGATCIRTCPSMRAVGYRQIWAHLDGQGTLADAAIGRGQAGDAQPGQAPADLAAGRPDPCDGWRALEDQRTCHRYPTLVNSALRPDWAATGPVLDCSAFLLGPHVRQALRAVSRKISAGTHGT